MRLCPAAALALAALLLAGPALAATTELADVAGSRVLLVAGGIEKGDADRVERAIREAGRVDEVWLRSDGGNLNEGMEIGRLLRRHGLAARVPSEAVCASACVYVLAGAPLRAVDGDGRVGVHMFTATGNAELVAAISRDIRTNGSDVAARVIRRIEQYAAHIAARQSAFLVEMAVSLQVMTPSIGTAYDAIHWLSPAELRRYNLVNTD
ncbi:MAG TPA: hypothetical protein PKA13_15730 [Geminicoccaceae bacterium]|nr:hypothetical protein [Geminicoccus sp.]HMU51224.1 hypothetical protein [Geminicoccaceae bacterium]